MRLPLLSLILLFAPFLSAQAQTPESAADRTALLAAQARIDAVVEKWRADYAEYQAAKADIDKLTLKVDENGRVLPWGPATAPYAQSFTLAERVANQVTVDPYGFTAWLNLERARRGLPPVTHDPSLSSHAQINNQHQAARGLGHHYHICRRQNAGMGSAASVWPAWTTSSGHAAALFDPTITRVGIAIDGQWQTFNAN
jgi:uncharacterized protein YkwD